MTQTEKITRAGYKLTTVRDNNNDLIADLLKIHNGNAQSNALQLIVEYYIPQAKPKVPYGNTHFLI